MSDPVTGYRDFVDGARRPIYDDGRTQGVIDDEGERIHGLFMIPEEKRSDLSIVVDGNGKKGEPALDGAARTEYPQLGCSVFG